MATSLRSLAIVAVLGGLATACAHASPSVVAQGPELPALGEDMPESLAPAPPSVVSSKLFSIDTPVGKLCGDPGAKAVVDRDLPGLTSRPEYMFFKHMTLRQLQAASRGQMPMADLDKVSTDLDALGRPAPVPFMRASASLP